MAIFGPFSTVRAQMTGDVRFAAAFHYVAELFDPQSVAHQRLYQIPVGTTERVELSGGSFALEQVYQSRPRPDVFLESHRKYIDVQVIVGGTERMEVQDITRLTVDQPYAAERDLVKYLDMTSTSHLAMISGNVAIFFPSDGHLSTLMPELGRVLMRKSVVKVPVE